MENKVKHYRESKNLTQGELAEKSGLSIRTIQRIEKGNIPKGHTLKVLSHALDSNPEDLFKKTEDLDKIKIINISTLSFLLIPFGNVILPLILTFKSTDENTRRMGKDIISIQILWSVITSFLLIISPFIQRWLSLEFPLLITVLIVLVGINLFLILINAVSLSNHSKLYKEPIIRIL